MASALKTFSIKKVNKTAAQFDMEKLKWVNAQYIKAADTKVLTGLLVPILKEEGFLAEALDQFKPGLGDVAMVLAFTGLRWEEAVAVPIASVSLVGQSMIIDRTASESGGRRDVHQPCLRAADEEVSLLDLLFELVLAVHGRPRRP